MTPTALLYERWVEVARLGGSEIALREIASGRQWSFHELASEGEKRLGSSPVAFPQGQSAEFIISVLRAWRAGQPVCPLETDQAAPTLDCPLPTNVAHLKTTSATTGRPRLVALSASQLAADADNIVETMGLRPDWPNLGVISLAHSYGFSNLVLPLLLRGIPLWLAWSALPEAVRAAGVGPGSLTLPAVPALWRAWHEARSIPPSVRIAISAGAPLPLSLERGVHAALGLKIHNFYGSSECGGIAYDASDKPREESTYAGHPMRNVEVTCGADGCLVVRSGAVAESYWPVPEPALGHGLFRTTDLGRIVGPRIFVEGRASDQINVAGRKLSPEAVERVLASHPGVQACVVFGIPSRDHGRGDEIIACLSARAELSREALRNFVLQHLPSWQVPRDWWVVEELKTNPRGKLPRAEWRQRYLERITSGSSSGL